MLLIGRGQTAGLAPCECTLIGINDRPYDLLSGVRRAGIILEFLNASLLWTLGKHLEPHLVAPFLTVPFIYWLPGVVGSLASANLDAKYIVTGASNAVCGLLGAPLL